jgi:hypothetical protein
VQSLEDTPEVYQVKQTKNVPLRKAIRNYLSSRERRDIIEDPDYSMANIRTKISAGDLQFLSVFELYLTSGFTFESEELSIDAPASENQGDSASSRLLQNRTHQRSSSNKIPKKPSISYSSGQLDLHRQALFAKLNDSVGMLLNPICALR